MTQADLFDKIYENEMSIKELDMADKTFHKEIFGELKITIKEDNIIVNQCTQKNKVLIWAKHAMIKLMAGQVFENCGANRKDLTLGVLSGKGTLLSGKQFLDNTSAIDFGLNNYFLDADYHDVLISGYVNPYFPTKMLFGTGFADIGNTISYSGQNENNSTAKTPVASDNTSIDLSTDGWIQSVHTQDDIASNSVENYGLGYAGDMLPRKNWGTFAAASYGNSTENWTPSFIYFKRTFPFSTDAQIKVTKLDPDYKEYTKMTFKCSMPSQPLNQYYPYNNNSDNSGVLIKYAGLFCDAALTEYDESGESFQKTKSGFENGLMWCKTALLAPIVKKFSNSIDWEWTLYIPRD